MAIELKRSKYRLLGLVGQGQFGKVFCAIHRKTGHLAALKNLDHQRFPTHKFLRELRFLLSLQHPNIVTCQALEHTRTGRCLILDYCEGGTLRGLMDRETSLNCGESLNLMVDILAGLAHAHGRGIVHCDIKPENIMLSLQPSGWLAKISDFGIAKLSQELAQEGGNTGSPAYMAPERFYGQYSEASDLYAVGVMLFELLIGDRPFSGSPTELMSAHLNHLVKIPGELPQALQAILLTALQKLPARRFRSALEMQQAIIAASTDSEVLPWLKHKPHSPFHGTDPLVLPLNPFQSCQQKHLTRPIHHLGINKSAGLNRQALTDQEQVYYAGGGSKDWHFTIAHLDCTLLQFEPMTSLIFREPIHQILLDPRGCLIVTQRAIYLLPTDAMEAPKSRLLTQLHTKCIASLEPRGAWIATVCAEPSSLTAQLKFWQLNWQAPPHTDPLKPIGNSVSRHWLSTSSLLPLDSRYLVLITEQQAGSAHKSGSWIEVFTRRGQATGCWKLPVLIQYLINSSVPYRLAALEKNNPASLLLIDLKPYRLQRISLEIQPVLIAAMPWGYVLTDIVGRIVLIDEEGRQLGRIDQAKTAAVETDQVVTAIAPFANYGIVLATWEDIRMRGFLYTIDLRLLDIDLVF
ncbi:hypothetical protein BST81_08050 [Leptolyngbya sp. 'hensonii']|uniref:serine/threonine-protein kinase n=1 Tax=Leptolyngbya sp. 'hensonii' TaxID=1922337 RepID=UPI00094FEBC1|nr:serine/threonine-protein kinase [Leptolyngbya sp. 'hensonii']OLP18860.1 hypothetical protein BST81_08050 [Leptolyngbya sp. 'hensonii']